MSDAALPLPKWLLGQELEGLRIHAGLELAHAAAALTITDVSVRRFETGKTLINELQLDTLLRLYSADDAVRERVMNLRELAAQPAWWEGLGPRPPTTATLLSMERAAVRIRTFDHSAIPGLLQTPAYARSVIRAVDDITGRKLEAAVKLRTERQAKVWEEQPPEANFMVDESALWRIPGTPEMRRAQVARLLNPPAGATIQVIPVAAGPLPATSTFNIFDFDSEVITKGVYAEGSLRAKDVAEAGEGVAEYEHVWERVRGIALTSAQTTQLLHEVMKGIVDE